MSNFGSASYSRLRVRPIPWWRYTRRPNRTPPLPRRCARVPPLSEGFDSKRWRRQSSTLPWRGTVGG